MVDMIESILLLAFFIHHLVWHRLEQQREKNLITILCFLLLLSTDRAIATFTYFSLCREASATREASVMRQRNE